MHLTRDRIHTDEDALLYLMDCTLATVAELGQKARPPKGELARQCSIAQVVVDHLRFSKRPPTHGRARHLPAHDWSVEAWAAALKS